MTSPSELLATLLLADRQRAQGASQEIGARALWDNAVALASSWRVVPALSRCLGRLELDLEPASGEQLSAALRRAAVQSTLICHRAAEALAALEQAAVPALAFKGVAAIGHSNGSPARRMLQDADLLVDEASVRVAVDALRRIGFELELPVDLDSWIELLGDRVYRDHEYIELRDADGVAVDLHWYLPFGGEKGLSVDEMLQRRVDVQLAGRTVPAGAPEDCLLLTVQHAVRDRLVPRVAIKDLLDVDGWFGLASLDPEVVSRRAAAVGLLDPLAAMAGILAAFDPAAAAANWLAGVEVENRRQVDRLTDFFHLQLREGEISRELMGMSSLSLSMLKRFATSRWRGLRDPKYRAVFHHHDQAPARWKGVRLLRELVRIRPSRIRLLRAMARETRKLA